MRWAVLLVCACVLGCDDELAAYYADGTEWEPVDVPASPGAILPRDMNARQWSEFLSGSGIQADRSPKSFTPTWTGFSADPIGDIYYFDFGKIVVMWRENDLTGTSNATTMTITNVPAEIRPGEFSRYVLCAITDDGALNSGAAILDTAGTLQFAVATAFSAPGKIVNNPSGFTNPASKGLPDGWIIVYTK